MSTSPPRILLRLKYEEAAQAYLRSLPLEHFMESTPQATQRKITLESFDLVKPHRPDLHVFNELLVQYPRPRGKIGQVVPDNMVVVCSGPTEANSSFNTPLEPAGPFWTLDYVSKSNRRKDYDDNMWKYEKELKVPYYLLFEPDIQEMTLYRRRRVKYVSVKPNARDRYEVEELEIEVALLGEWVRYWYRGELLLLPADLQRNLNEERQARRAAEEEVARLRAEVERLRKKRNNGG